VLPLSHPDTPKTFFIATLQACIIQSVFFFFLLFNPDTGTQDGRQ